MSAAKEHIGRLAHLLGGLSRGAALSFDEARGLTPALYHSQPCLELEIERIFKQEWICIGRGAEMPEYGDYLTFEIVDQPVVAIRQKDGSIRAFANACAHRCSRLLDGAGNAKRICCPYHSWTYTADGQLVGAPYMDQTPGFDVKSFRLAELRSEVWEGFVYVNLDRDAAPLAEGLGELTQVVGQYRMADYEPVMLEEDVWHTNWKCLVENFMDAYHIHRVHAKSFGAHGKSEEFTTLFPGGPAFTYHHVDKESSNTGWGNAHPDNSWLKGDYRKRIMLLCVYPAHTIQLQPDMLWYLSIQPAGTEQVRIRWAVAIPSEILDSVPDREAHIAELRSLLDQVNSEDRPTVERLLQTAKSERATPGPMSYLERNVFEFDRYLARKLCP